jgi:hypothetical protein
LTALTQAIRKRGHWRVSIRPADYNGERIEYANLASIIDRSRVSLRGWDLPPHIRSSATLHGDNWIGGESDATSRPQAWRFHQNGQFVLLRAIWTDHIEPMDDAFRLSRHYPPTQAGPVLPVGDTVFTLTEAFEFASRLAMTEAGSDPMVLDFDLRGLKDRILWVDDPNRSGMDNQYRFNEAELSRHRSVPRSVLVGEAWNLAVDAALDIYSRFGWNPPRHLVEGQQATLRRS